MRRQRIVLVLAVLLCGLAIPSLQAGATKLDPLASFPIAAIGCTPTDVCLAVGTGIPTRVAWNQHGGPWITAMAPALRFDRSNVLSIGCSRYGCLLAGASGGHVATWIFDSGSHLIRASRWRLAGSGTSSVSCLPTGGCALLSYTKGVRTIGYLALSRDGGRHWLAQRPIVSKDGWVWTMSITNMACIAPTSCLVVGGSGGTLMGLGVAQTSDGGGRWHAGVDDSLLPASAIACSRKAVCFAIGFLDSSTPYRLISSSDDGRTWRRVAAVARADTGGIACTVSGWCTTGAAAPHGRPWFAARSTRTLFDADALQPALVGCGDHWCAAALAKRVIEFRAPDAG